ncbi:hypothetical protein GCM10023194_34360 [Planotetraspora phitsanulokensis]|uniref:alpha-L-fucosidase n=1 Tax=Planotetraspora phitsanulokensis TaxID=575192 RepID=A0A8J3UCA8_9ACTN|nr:alpha-L-fucosidase [Planotetraspora phitsanulokensis]GII36435.1 hypothetical protein Pph01_14380 [Planotetraspora phitsanulokensis]
MIRRNELVQASGADLAALALSRQAWLRDDVIGLFLHWGMRTSPPFTDVRAWEDRVTADGWTADHWIDRAVQLHAGYVVLASFHSRLGYVRAWPSEIPGSPATRRDFLGELVAAAASRGLRVLLYMTDDPKWHDEDGLGSLDSAAYSAYKGRPVDLTTRDGFGEFAADNFAEVMRRHPDLAGFWIDKENAHWRRSGLYDRIRAERPGWILACNDPDIPPGDTAMDVVVPGLAADGPLPRVAESAFTVAGGWWYDGSDPEVDHDRVVRRIVANAGSSTRSLLGFGSRHGGRFTPNQEAFCDFAASYLEGIWESLGGTEGGRRPSPADVRPGPATEVTVRGDDPDRRYIHVIGRPADDTVRVRDDSRHVIEVRDLRTGRSMPFEQSDGRLTISGITTWDPHDTVLALRTARSTSGTASPRPAASENTPHHSSEGTSS